ncbi:MAG: hypothetical protein C4532_19285 [Candidatus Abyssobacteria bacterium SURF_17]|uniref:Uncharacterized protein n=1 Tax=Candidatus Abyssobacteria bacterium SURF_17 TaxID=2093361 RepID=A0A419ENZ6_9BACT|nr:MAG: hypothetical protein C4532_19285 [Candidatus Abyssubacteria bacterium SURF_17]
MAYCQSCGRYVGDYSAYRHSIPGKGDAVLCYRCKRWVDRHPGQSTVPSKQPFIAPERKRVRTFANIYVVSSLGVFAFGGVLALTGKGVVPGVICLLAGVSLFFIGVGMKKAQKS